MKNLHAPAILLAVSLLAPLGCETKVSQCNKLIEVVNHHTDKLSGAIENLDKFDEDPSVAKQFVEVVDAADTEIAALELEDETVAGFAKDYRDLMTEAKKLGTGLEEAGTDMNKRNEVVANANSVVAMEDEIVQKVNTYCQAP